MSGVQITTANGSSSIKTFTPFSSYDAFLDSSFFNKNKNIIIFIFI